MKFIRESGYDEGNEIRKFNEKCYQPYGFFFFCKIKKDKCAHVRLVEFSRLREMHLVSLAGRGLAG